MFIQSHTKPALILKSRLGVEEDWETRWSTLSHGERKRAQIGVALWREPDVLAVDEPTNHLDAQARDMLKNALEAFTGVGLLVSHDRELLDSLCDQCCFIDPLHSTSYDRNFVLKHYFLPRLNKDILETPLQNFLGGLYD